MNIRQITDGKEDYIELLRMGDPDESRIRKVLEEGELFLLEEHGKPVSYTHLTLPTT